MGRLGRMIWRDGEETPEGGVEAPPEENTDPIRIERDAPRPAMILKVAGELEERGGTILSSSKRSSLPSEGWYFPYTCAGTTEISLSKSLPGRGMSERPARHSIWPLYYEVRSMPEQDWRYSAATLCPPRWSSTSARRRPRCYSLISRGLRRNDPG